MIKPDFWGDEKMATVSLQARLIYIGLWNYSDDFAVVKGHRKWLRNTILPYDLDLEQSAFDGWIDELIKIYRIMPFSVRGESFFWIPKFSDHQKIQKPSKQARNPQVPQEIIDEYLNSTGGVAYYSDTPTIPLRDEKKLKEKKRKENNVSGIVQETIKHLNEATKSNFNPAQYMTQSLIYERVEEGFTLQDFKAVIDLKAAQWIDDKKMSGSLRPGTLFASDKFEGYLQEAKRNGNGSGASLQTAQLILKHDGSDACQKYCLEHGLNFAEVGKNDV
jgi:uncharacterized phage protein (TIGR02220 family)